MKMSFCMVSKQAKQIINSIKPNLTRAPPGPTEKGSAGYDNIRDDIEKTKSLREGTVEKVPVNNSDITNKKYVDDSIDTDITTHINTAQAHSDYLRNDANDTTTGTLTAAGFTTAGTYNGLGITTAGSIVTFTPATGDALLWDTSLPVGFTIYSPAIGTDLSVTADCIIDQNLQTTASPTFVEVFCGGFTHTGDANTRFIFGTDFYYLEAGGLEMARFNAVGKNPSSIFNNDGIDLNFHVKTNNDANTLWIDGGTDKVGIGTATPGKKLDVLGDISLEAGTGSYYSSDASQGITQSETGVTDFDIVIKDGIITSFTKN